MGTKRRRGTIPSELADITRPGELLGGKYRIDAVLGRGGMSVVLRATHVELEHAVAIKVLSPSALVVPEYASRLRSEARAASRLRSEHVVRVYDVGEIAGSGAPYLVMEYLRGADLAEVLSRRGPMPADLACECLLQACEALAEAHALGIVHRDLKPANLFLTEDGDGAPFVKVLDFGISRSTSRERLGPSTDPGIVLGTPAYMSPEQMEGKGPLDARTDIWALGTILHELVVGEPRFRGDSLPKIFISILRSPPPRPSRLRRDVPPLVDAIVARCLAVDPDERYGDVAELARDLSRVVDRGGAAAERVARALGRGVADRGAPRLPTLRAAKTRARFGAAAVVSMTLGGLIGFGAISAASPVPPGESHAPHTPHAPHAPRAPHDEAVAAPEPAHEVAEPAARTGEGDAGLASAPEALPVTAKTLP